MTSMYQRTRLSGEAKDAAGILSILSDIRSGRRENDLQLLNFYRQLPVTFGATVLTVEEKDAEFQVNRLQALVIASEKISILKSSHFPSDVLASASSVKIEKSQVVLSNFSYALVRAQRRKYVRVELSDPVFASFTSPNGTLGGILHDMSLTGITINISQDPQIPISQKGVLAVTLPTGTFKVPASLLKVLTPDEGYRLVFQIGATPATEACLSQYIMRRQVEIIRELKNHPDPGC
jgi:hypothetical protein